MYLNPFSNKIHKEEEDEVINQQLHGWVYESHCWCVIKSHDHTYKVCKWCGRKSTIDMVIDGPQGHTMCAKNPSIRLLIEQRVNAAIKNNRKEKNANRKKQGNTP